MNPFSQSSYLAQVRRLRALANKALNQYPIRVKSIEFINHGENTTFQVQSHNGRKYLLRVHRTNYHTPRAIQEELKWLERIAKTTDLAVPIPVRSKNGKLIESVDYPGVDQKRNCDLFAWVDGRFVRKSLSPRHLFQLGQVIGRLQKNSRALPVHHRRYWTAEGLVGKNPKFGIIDDLAGVSWRQQKVISHARRRTLKKLQWFEKKFPDRLGLIHADLHFGNIITNNGRLGLIDFDDCGFGFHAYDLTSPLLSVQFHLGPKGKKRFPQFKKALIEGYATHMPWDKHDEDVLAHLLLARSLTMLGWLNSRSDNPRLRAYLPKAVKRSLNYIKHGFD